MDNVDNKASSEPTEITMEAALHRKINNVDNIVSAEVEALHRKLNLVLADIASLHAKFDAAVARIEVLGGSMADNPALKAISKMFGGK